MSLDILGPANAPNATTTRPPDDRSFGVTDTWFKDCTSSVANDGTKLKSAFMNAVSGAFRALIRANGNTAGAVPIVAEDNSDDAMALKSIQHLIQRGQPKVAALAGSATALTLALTPAAAEYKNGMVVMGKVQYDSVAGGTTLNVNGLGARPVVRYDGAAVDALDMLAGGFMAFIYDGAAHNFQMAWAQRQPGAPIFLTAARTYYVNGSTGNDSFDGRAATVTGSVGPFATLQKAINTIALFNLNGFNVTVNVADATYTGGATLAQISGSGRVMFIGNAATPSNCLISTSNRSAIIAGYCGTAYSFNGFKVQATGAAPGDSITGVNAIGPGTSIDLFNMNYGVCVGSHISALSGAQVVIGGTQTISGGCTGNALVFGWHIYATQFGIVATSPVSPPSLTISVAVTFSSGFISAANLAVTSLSYTAVANPGNLTGTKFYALGNAVINAFGAGINYYPGSAAGAVNSGGQYL